MSVSTKWKGGFVLSLLLLLVTPTLAQTARVQFIQASPDIRAWNVDIYANGEMLVDDFIYASATPYVEVPAGEVEFTVAGRRSTSAADGFATLSKTLTEGTDYYAVITGLLPNSTIENPDGRSIELAIKFDRHGGEVAEPGRFRLQQFHASPDFASYDFWTNPSNPRKIHNGVQYGYFSGVASGPVSKGNGFVLAKDSAWPTLIDLEPRWFDALSGKQAIEVLIGYASRDGHAGRPLQWLWVYPDGSTEFLPIIGRAAEVQFVAASPDPDITNIDVWVDGHLVHENIEYAGCTPFITVPGAKLVEVLFTPTGQPIGSKVFSKDTIFPSFGFQQAIIAGVTDPTAYPANPDGKDTSLNVFVDDGEYHDIPNDLFGWRSFNAVLDWEAFTFFVGESAVQTDVGFGEFGENIVGTPSPHPGSMSQGGDQEISNFSGMGGEALTTVWMGTADEVAIRIYKTDGTEYLSPLIEAADSEGALPDEFRLVGNYPNPFNPSTQILFELPQTTHVRLDIHDALGRRIATLVDGIVEAGQSTVNWSASGSLPSGIYFYTLTTTTQRLTRPMTLLK